MSILKNIVVVLYIILCVTLIILATVQAKDSQGASGAITGSTTNNFYEKNKGRQAQAEAVIPLDRLFKEMDRLYGQGKEIVLNIDGRQFMRAVAPYQRELDSYNRRSAKFAY